MTTATRWIKNQISWQAHQHNRGDKHCTSLEKTKYVTDKLLAKWSTPYLQPEAKYPLPRWLELCTEVRKWPGVHVWVYDSKTTVSKYVYLSNGDPIHTYKIRFSNHFAAKHKQEANDSDFYVGRHHFGTMTTSQLLATLKRAYQVQAVEA